MSYTKTTFHIIICPWRRHLVIEPDHERELYKFIFDLSTNRGVKIWRIGGMPDHIHILCDLPAKTSVSEYIRLIKSESSKFLRINSHFPSWKKWSKDYACVSVDAETRSARIDYIKNQKEHHRYQSFTDEFRQYIGKNDFDDDISMLGDGDTDD